MPPVMNVFTGCLNVNSMETLEDGVLEINFLVLSKERSLRTMSELQIMICRECKSEMVIDDEVAGAGHYICPHCGYRMWVVQMTRAELRRLARLSYDDGRHWNHGGGLNKS